MAACSFTLALTEKLARAFAGHAQYRGFRITNDGLEVMAGGYNPMWDRYAVSGDTSNHRAYRAACRLSKGVNQRISDLGVRPELWSLLRVEVTIAYDTGAVTARVVVRDAHALLDALKHGSGG